jgi:hypothetical protein
MSDGFNILDTTDFGVRAIGLRIHVLLEITEVDHVVTEKVRTFPSRRLFSWSW